MKNYNLFYATLRGVSDQASKFARYNFGDNWSCVARSNGISFCFSPESLQHDLVFFVRLNQDRVPILEFPRVDINFAAPGLDDNYHFMLVAFDLVSDLKYRRALIEILGDLCDLADDCGTSSLLRP